MGGREWENETSFNIPGIISILRPLSHDLYIYIFVFFFVFYSSEKRPVITSNRKSVRVKGMKSERGTIKVNSKTPNVKILSETASR